MDFTTKSLKKKFKDKRFAAGCSRDVISQGAEMLGWELPELLRPHHRSNAVLRPRPRHLPGLTAHATYNHHKGDRHLCGGFRLREV